MKTRYSPSRRNFYPLDTDYSDLPEDVVDVPLSEYLRVMNRAPDEQFDYVDGEFVISKIPGPTPEQIRADALAEVRAQRAPMLDALDGIANRAFRAGDMETSEAADVAANALLDITVWPAFLSAQTYEDMKAAIMARYRQIAAAAPESVQVVFKEVFG